MPWPTRCCTTATPPAVLRLEAEVEAFVGQSEEPQHVFSGDMSSYEVGAVCAAWLAASGRGSVGGGTYPTRS